LRHEWATNAADILWRRSKLGLHFPKGSEAVLDAWLAARGGQSSGQEPLAEAGELLQAASR